MVIYGKKRPTLVIWNARKLKLRPWGLFQTTTRGSVYLLIKISCLHLWSDGLQNRKKNGRRLTGLIHSEVCDNCRDWLGQNAILSGKYVICPKIRWVNDFILLFKIYLCFLLIFRTWSPDVCLTSKSYRKLLVFFIYWHNVFQISEVQV